LGISDLSATGLIAGNILGQSIAITSLWIMTLKDRTHLYKEITISKQLKLAKEYINFPKFSILSDLFTIANTQLSILFISKYFTLTSVGFFSFILRVISIPTSILSSAIGDIFKQQASEYYVLNKECHTIYLNTLKKLFLLAIVPFSLLFIYSQQIFIFIFGKEWYIAGEYAQLLSPMFFLQFISSPLSAMFYIAEKQALYLKISATMLLAMISLFLLVYTYELDMKNFLLGYTLIYSFVYLINIFITYSLSKKTI
jgi:O-antigen/teichoic acid export membrane protein